MRNKKITKEDLINTFERFETKTEAAKSLGIDRTLFNYYLKKENLEFKRKQDFESAKYNFIDDSWLVENWVHSNKSLQDLANELNCDVYILQRKSEKYDIHKKFKNYFNSTKLYNLNDSNVYYLAGLIATDGYLDVNSSRISISLCGNSEFELLKDIYTYFESTATVKELRKNVYNICFADDNIREFFRDNFNIPLKNKTFNLRIPSYFPNEDCLKSYILGCFDGDGCISHLNNGRPTVALTTASKEFILELINIIYSYTNIKFHYYENKYSTMIILKKQEVLKFLNWVYSSSTSLKLKRKFERYLRVKDIVWTTE